MRRFLVSFVFVAAGTALAQDPGMLATQQMIQQQQIDIQNQQIQQQQVQQQVMLSQQQAMDQATLASMNGYQYGAMKPSFHVQPGSTAGAITVRLKDRTRKTTIFYTTNGWSPTPASRRYEGPITLAEGTVVRAIAVAPGSIRSGIAVWTAALPGTKVTPTSLPPHVPGAISALDTGVPIALMFTQPVNSHGLQVGDKLPVALADDLVEGSKVVARRSTPVIATVTQVDNRGFAGQPGSLSFVARSVELEDGTSLKLSGGETMEADPRTKPVFALAAIPFVGAGALLVRGKEAEIPQGAIFHAVVAGHSSAAESRVGEE